MYHMLPFSYRPQANYTRAQHGEFQNIVETLVDKILSETEIIDAQCPNGRKLFNSIDTFFSYGLLTADGAYWRCIKNFLPRAEQKMLIAECGNANDRFLSIGWLKTSLNKGTLHFMLLSLNNQSNKKYLKSYYHRNACIRNSGLLEAITNFIEKLHTVQFAFYSTRQMRLEVAPAAVVDTAAVQISSRAAARQRKLTEREASSDTVPNVVPTEVPSILTQAIDQDVLLDELVRNRHNRLNNEIYEDDNVSEGEVRNEEQRVATEEKLEDVITKKMSCANMELMNPDGIEEILASAAPEEEPVPEYIPADGEYLMSQGDILHFAINVFEKSSEKIIETFKVVESFHSGHRKLRYFVMTNYNLYVFKYRVHTTNASPGLFTNLSSEGFFIPTIRMPHDRIKTIKIGIDNLSFLVESNELGFSHYNHNEERTGFHYSYFAAMAGLESGAHMINALINVVEHSSRPNASHPEIDDHIGYMCLLQPNLEKILNSSVDIRNAFLCYWFEQSSEEQAQTSSSMSGFLFKSNVTTWIKSSEEAQHIFCMIIGQKFHVFTDSTCKTEEMVIDLSSASLTTGTRTTFQLKASNGNFEFECTTLDEWTNWTKTLAAITEKTIKEPYVTPCLAVITQNSLALVQEGEKFWTDGFLRLLNNLTIEKMQQGFVVVPPENKKQVLPAKPFTVCIVTNDNVAHYFFVRFETELTRFAGVISNLCNIECKKLEEPMSKDSLEKTIYNTCCSITNMWLNS